MRFLLDTNTCVDFLRRQYPAVAERIEKAEVEELCTSSIVEAELRYGAEHSADPDRNHALVDALLAEIPCLGFDSRAAQDYGRIRHTLKRRGSLIGPNDLLIAAHAVSLGLILVTDDVAEFSRVEGLRVENWRSPAPSQILGLALHQIMDRERFRQIVQEGLVPLLGARLEEATSPIRQRRHLASYQDPCRLAIRPKLDAGFELFLVRSQKFDYSENMLADDFLGELGKMDRVTSGPYLGDLLATLPRRVVARHLRAGPFLSSVLEQFDSWSAQTYEEHRITAGVGLEPEVLGTGIAASDFWREDFAPVLTNGFDTLLVCSKDGFSLRFEQLDSPTVPNGAPA